MRPAPDVAPANAWEELLRGPWRHAEHVLARPASVFPPRCIRCGRTADGRPSRVTLRVHRPRRIVAVALTLAPLAALLDRFATPTDVTVFTCADHRRRRSVARRALALGLVGGPLLIVLAVAQRPPSGVLGVAALVLMVTALIAYRPALGTPLRGWQLRGDRLLIVGAGKGFRETLPFVPDTSEIARRWSLRALREGVEADDA